MSLEDKIKRINELYHKSQDIGLTDEEKEEQKRLRQEYVESVRNNLKSQLDSINIQEADGSITNLGKKFGKKKLVIAGFLGLAICYAIAGISSIPGLLPEQGAANGLSWAFGAAIMIISALPMALLGIIPQSIVADVAEAEAVTTGQNREGMFFAARTFAMKFGQSLAMILFTSLAVAMPDPSSTGDEVFPGKAGMILVAAAAVLFCVAGAVILLFYREKKIMKTIAKEGDEAFMKAIESEKDLGEEKEEEK